MSRIPQRKAKVAVIIGWNGGANVIPGTIIVSRRDNDVMIRNYTGKTIKITGAIKGTITAGEKKKAFDISGLAEGVHEYKVSVGRFIAEGNSAPRLIIDE